MPSTGNIRQRSEHLTAFIASLPLEKTVMSDFAWKPAKSYTDIRYEHFDGIAKITINRPEVRNAFRPIHGQ